VPAWSGSRSSSAAERPARRGSKRNGSVVGREHGTPGEAGTERAALRADCVLRARPTIPSLYMGCMIAYTSSGITLSPNRRMLA